MFKRYFDQLFMRDPVTKVANEVPALRTNAGAFQWWDGAAWARSNVGTEDVYTMTTALIDGANGGWQTRTLAGNETLTFSLVAGASVFVTIIPGANTLTLTNVNEWVGGVAPTTIEAEHGFVFWSDDGVTITGNSVGGIA